MEKMTLHTPNITDENIAKLKECFPDCITEIRDETGKVKNAIDFDQLRQALSDSIVEGSQERYRLDWPGKREALLTANTPITKTLRPCRRESVDFDTTQNLFIEGDNLDALKLLQETYLGKVKMIYIDPPYNTGKDFIYKDHFAAGKQDYLEDSGQIDAAGGKLISNPDSNGRYHSDWLSMLYPRLKLARNLLRDDGVIFVSCDEGEHPRLRMMMDEVFGQSNFIADMVWAAGKKNDSKLVSVSHEYIVCYVKNVEFLRTNKIIWRQKKKGLSEIYKEGKRLRKVHGGDFDAITVDIKEWFKSLADSHPSKAHQHYCHIDERGIYFPDNISWPGGGGPKYEVLHPVTKQPVKVPSRGWKTSNENKMRQWIADDLVHFGETEGSVPCMKSYLKDRELQAPYSVFYQDGRAASKRLRTLMDGDLFEFPKNEIVLQEMIEMLTSENDIILDFFAGSATTAHAVMQQNAGDGGKRQFIMVQLAEVCDEKTEAFKAGYKNIADLSKERIRRAGKKINEESPITTLDLDTGFRVLKIDTSNRVDVYYTPETTKQDDLLTSVDNIKPERDPEDLLFQVLVDWGVDLTLPIRRETIQEYSVFFVNHEPCDLIACFDKGITEALIRELATHKPVRVIFRDNGFVSDAVKINVEQIFRQCSPDTDLKSI